MTPRSVLCLAVLALGVACGRDDGQAPASDVPASGSPEASLLDGLPPAPERPPHILLILVDTLRRDHLATYGYDQPTSERLDGLAAQGWVFERHLATASQTVPSTLSLMTGQYPAQHGFQHEGPGHFSRHKPLYPEELTLLPEVLASQGYATAGFVGNPFLQEQNGFDQGFSTFAFDPNPADWLTDRALGWLQQQAGQDRPVFLYLHYFDVHWPYEPPPRWLERFPAHAEGQQVYLSGLMPPVADQDRRATVAAYDAGVAWVDSEIGRLVDGFDRLLGDRPSLVAVTSDHGDEFLEHGGMGHGTTVYGELIQVPLILRMAERLEPGRRLDHLSSQVDLAPTLLALAGLERPAPFDGPLVLDPAPQVFAENGPWRTVHRQGHKLVVHWETGRAELFGLDDRLDQRPLQDPRVTAALRQDLSRYAELEALFDGAAPGAAPDDWSEEEIEALRALGYVR